MITLIIEDGTGIEDANAYIDASFVSAYASLQGDEQWCNNTSLQNQAIVQASQFLDLRYSERYCGTLVNADQGMLFPRMIKDKNTGIPKQLKNAVAQLALDYITNGNGLDLNANLDTGIKQQEVSVGNGAVVESITYFDKASASATSAFAISDRYVNQLMQNIGCECRGKSSMFIQAYRG